ncbi:MAG: hypothetical protein GEV05_01435 [Betaproteobacteria bacterium]|nr:hypothetical protein [Betaproteobacteria bacterium]
MHHSAAGACLRRQLQSLAGGSRPNHRRAANARALACLAARARPTGCVLSRIRRARCERQVPHRGASARHGGRDLTCKV